MGAMQLGMDMRLCGPSQLWPDDTYRQELEQIASATNVKLMISDDIISAVAGADFVYTDVWVSMERAIHQIAKGG
jgi:ornithine carbamoyltransferase